MNKSLILLVCAFVLCAYLSVVEGSGSDALSRVKRGHGGGGGGHSSYPGSGGGAAGPVYFCGYVGKGEGSRGYGGGGGYGRRR